MTEPLSLGGGPFKRSNSQLQQKRRDAINFGLRGQSETASRSGTSADTTQLKPVFQATAAATLSMERRVFVPGSFESDPNAD